MRERSLQEEKFVFKTLKLLTLQFQFWKILRDQVPSQVPPPLSYGTVQGQIWILRDLFLSNETSHDTLKVRFVSCYKKQYVNSMQNELKNFVQFQC